MSDLFADTSYFIALIDKSDAAHNLAVAQTLSLSGKLITSDFVLTECAAWFSGHRLRTAFVRLVEQLKPEPNMLIVPCDRTLFEKGFDLYKARMDKAWSLVDCTSIALMQELTLTDALTTDHHFTQAGFNVLLKV